MLARKRGVSFDELPCCSALVEYPVYEVEDSHVRAVEDGYLACGCVFHIVCGFLV